ncbi:sushi, von Willebrand factor type A, EGF and pentraxin domain-containing protein 1-like isoform X2 [Halichondria panicea]|uniref:sushi, von Willebrand factor type A, EGF and pentraxin domain-containing protein 1-like isoform X2 n=1 Tax=Halichondria panicea TaxID=6063 RepID=UPI00312BA213
MTQRFLKFYNNITVIFYLSSQSATTAQYSVSVERPCPMETVTFTCTTLGDVMRWAPSDVTDITVLSTLGLNLPQMQSGYTVTLIAFNDTTLTSTLSRTAENGITVSCVDPLPNLITIGSSMIQLVDPPGPPSTIRHSILSSSADAVSVSVQWSPPTETGGRNDLTYTVTISPPPQLSATVLTSTSVTVTAQYNVDYAVSIVATNCAGNSTTAEYNFRIGGCLALTNPMNGAFEPVFSRLPGSTVNIQCDAGYVSAVAMVTCDDTLMWSPNPEATECTSLPTLPPTTPPMNCRASLPPPRNGTIGNHSVPAIPGTQVTFQCDDGLFPERTMTATCLATGEWDKNPGEIVCRNESILCVLPVPQLNGALLNTNSQNTEGSVITFQCDPGFSLVGAVTASCNNSGLWDPDPALLKCMSISFQSPILFTGEILSISVVVTAVAFTVIGFLTGLLVMHLCSRKKAVYFPAAKGQANIRPTTPVGPVYEEVAPKEEIELNTNQAYGPLGL